MKKIYSPFLAIGLFLTFQMLVFMPACTNDELPEPTVSAVCDTLEATYDTNVSAIIDKSCAYSACHSGNSTTGAPGNFTSYDGMLFFLNSGSFKTRVLDTESGTPSAMPPPNSDYDASQKDSLTSEELQIIECWLSAGHPEN